MKDGVMSYDTSAEGMSGGLIAVLIRQIGGLYEKGGSFSVGSYMRWYLAGIVMLLMGTAGLAYDSSPYLGRPSLDGPNHTAPGSGYISHLLVKEILLGRTDQLQDDSYIDAVSTTEGLQDNLRLGWLQDAAVLDLIPKCRHFGNGDMSTQPAALTGWDAHGYKIRCLFCKIYEVSSIGSTSPGAWFTVSRTGYCYTDSEQAVHGFLKHIVVDWIQTDTITNRTTAQLLPDKYGPRDSDCSFGRSNYRLSFTIYYIYESMGRYFCSAGSGMGYAQSFSLDNLAQYNSIYGIDGFAVTPRRFDGNASTVFLVCPIRFTACGYSLHGNFGAYGVRWNVGYHRYHRRKNGLSYCAAVIFLSQISNSDFYVADTLMYYPGVSKIWPCDTRRSEHDSCGYRLVLIACLAGCGLLWLFCFSLPGYQFYDACLAISTFHIYETAHIFRVAHSTAVIFLNQISDFDIYVADSWADYPCVSKIRLGNTQRSERAPLGYRLVLFACLACGLFWLSSLPHLGSQFLDAYLATPTFTTQGIAYTLRILYCAAVVFLRQISDLDVYVADSPTDYSGVRKIRPSNTRRSEHDQFGYRLVFFACLAGCGSHRLFCFLLFGYQFHAECLANSASTTQETPLIFRIVCGTAVFFSLSDRFYILLYI